MPELSLIVAIDAQGGIGVRNTLPWRLPEDLAHFKRVTNGHPIVMGRKTFDSIGRALPNRRNIVVTRNPAWAHEGVEAAGSLEQALALAGPVDSFVIGGAQLYAEAIKLADQLIVTEIAQTFACDAFFPAIDKNVWHESARQAYYSTASELAYAFVTLRRIGAPTL